MLHLGQKHCRSKLKNYRRADASSMSECGTRRKKGASKGKQHGAHVLRVLKLHEALPHVSGWLRNNHCPQVGPSLDDDRVCECLQLQSSYNGFKASKLQDKAKAKPEKGSENGPVNCNSADNRSLSTEKKSLPAPEEKARPKPEKRENGSEDRRRGTGIVDNKNARPNEKTLPARKSEPLPQREVQRNKSGWLPQRETERNIFAEDVDLTILFEDIPLESIPLPEGPYIPPQNGRPHLDSPLPKEQPTKEAARKPAVVPSDEKPKRRSKWDIPPSDQRLESDTLNQKESTTLSAKPKSLEQKELETCRKAQAEVQRPKAETKQQEVAPSAQPVKETKTKDVPPREVSSKSSELDRQQKQTAEQRLPRRSPAEQLLETSKKERESQPETPREAKERTKPEQVSKPSRQEAKEGTKPEQLSKTSKQEANEGTKPEQSSKSGDIREKLKKLRRESIMSVLDLEPFETGVKASPAPPASKVEEDGASLCRKGWNAIPQYQREAAYFSLDKTKAQKPRGPLRNEGAAASKADVRDSPRPITTKKPEFKLSKDKPASSTSAGTTDQDALSSRTTAGQRKWDQFLRRQIQGNVVTQPMPGYLSFGNKIVNPAPSVRPPVKEQTASTSKDADRPSAERHEKKASPPERVRPAARAESVTAVEGTAIKKQPPKDSSAAQLKGAAEAKSENLSADLPAEKNAPTKVTMNATSSEELNRKNTAEPEKPSAKLPTDDTTPEEKMVVAMTAPLKSSNDAQQEEMLAVTLPESTAITEKAEAAAQAPLQKSIDAAPENLPAGLLRENTTPTEGKPADEVSPARLDKKQESLAAGVLPESATVAEGAEVDEKLMTKLARSTDQEPENLSRVSLPESAAPTETVVDEISEVQLKKSVDEEVKPTSPVSSPQNAALTGIAATNETSQAELQGSTEKEFKDIAPVVVPALENVALTYAATEEMSQGRLKISGDKEAENIVPVPSPENAVKEVGANEISQVPSPEKVTVTEETAVEVKNIRDQEPENVGPVPPPENTAFAEAVADETSQAELKRSPAEEAENMAVPSPERAPVMAVVAACDDLQVTSPEKVALTEAAADEVSPAASTENTTLIELAADERSQLPSAVEAASTDEMVQVQPKEISNLEVEHIPPVLLPDNSALTQEKTKDEMTQAQLERRPEPESLLAEPSREYAKSAEVADEMLQAQSNKIRTDQEKEDASSLPLLENATLTEETVAKEMVQPEVERSEDPGAENVSTVSLPEHVALTEVAVDETSHIPSPEEVTSAVETAADETLQAQLKRSTAEVESMAPVLSPENAALVEVAADEMPQMKRSTDKEAENRSPVASPQLKRHTDQEAEDTLAAPSPENAPLTEAAANETSQAELTRPTDQEAEYTSPEKVQLTGEAATGETSQAELERCTDQEAEDTSPETAPLTEVADEMPQTELKTCIDQVGEDTISLPSPENALLTEEAVADETSQVEPKRRSDQETDETSAVISPENAPLTEAAADETLQAALKERIDQDAQDTSPENAPLTEAAADETLPAVLKEHIDQQEQVTSPENAPLTEAAADETLQAALKERIDQDAQDTSPENAPLTEAAADEMLPAALKEHIDQQEQVTSPENAPLTEAAADETLQVALKERIDQDAQDTSPENAPLTEAADETLPAALKEHIDQQEQVTSPENAPLTEAAADEMLQAELKESIDQEVRDTSPENAPLAEAAADETLQVALKERIDQVAQDTSPENAPLTEAAADETLQAVLKERIDQQAQDTSPENAPLTEAAADETLQAALKERIDQQEQDTSPENAPLTEAAADETLQAALKERIDQQEQDTSPENAPLTEAAADETLQAALKERIDQQEQDTSPENAPLTEAAADETLQAALKERIDQQEQDTSPENAPFTEAAAGETLQAVLKERIDQEVQDTSPENGSFAEVVAVEMSQAGLKTLTDQEAQDTSREKTSLTGSAAADSEMLRKQQEEEEAVIKVDSTRSYSEQQRDDSVDMWPALLEVVTDRPQKQAVGIEREALPTVLAPMAAESQIETALEQGATEQTGLSSTFAGFEPESTYEPILAVELNEPVEVAAEIECALSPQPSAENVETESASLAVQETVKQMQYDTSETREHGITQEAQIHQPRELATVVEQEDSHTAPSARYVAVESEQSLLYQNEASPTKADLGSDSSLTEEYQYDFGDEAVVEVDQVHRDNNVSAEDKDSVELAVPAMVLEQAGTEETGLEQPLTEDHADGVAGGSLEDQPTIIIWQHPGLPTLPQEDIVGAEDKDTAEDSLSVMVLEQADTKEESLDRPPMEDQTSELPGDYESERGSVESQPAIIIWRHPGLPASPEDTQAKAAPFVPTVETGRLEQVNLDADRLAQTMQASILPADEQAMSHVPEHDTGTPVCNIEDSVVERTETTELRGHKDSDDTKQTQDAERVENVKDDTNALATTPLRDSSVEAELECAATIQEQSTDSTEGYYEGTSKWETLSEELTPPSSPLRGEDSSSVQASAASTVQDIQPVDSILEPQDIEVASVIEISTEEILVDAAAEDVCTRFETRHEELANEGASQLNLNLPTDNAAASPVPSLPSEDTCTDVLQQVAPIDLSLHHPVLPSPLSSKENPPRSSHEELEAAISRLTLTPETDQRTASTHPMTTEVRSPGLPDRPCESLTTDLSGTTTKDTEQLPRPTPERSVLEPSEVNPEDSQTSAPPTLPASETDGEKLSSDNTESAQLIDETIDETPLEPSTSSRKRKPAGRRQATRRRAANSPAEPAPPSKRARVQSSEVSPAEPETKEPESAVAKPKRKKQSAEECPKADAEPVMPLRRSTRSRKQTQRFCF
ncbi:uncharacterized protein LOC144151933 isoform X2 [Haemaphysalis longicornis]